MTPRTQFLFDVQQERKHQDELGWNDEYNSAGAWVCYIVNYVSRWAMPASFDADKYTFYRCMVKSAALCCAAAEWFLADKETGEIDTIEIPKLVSEGVE